MCFPSCETYEKAKQIDTNNMHGIFVIIKVCA